MSEAVDTAHAGNASLQLPKPGVASTPTAAPQVACERSVRLQSPKSAAALSASGSPRTDVPARRFKSFTTELQKKASATRAGFQRPKFWVLAFGWSLGACAGLVNTVSYKSWGLYVSHMTGTTAAISMRIEGYQQGEHDFNTLGEALWLVLSFLLGAFACGLLIDKNQVHFLGKAFYGSALVGNAGLLTLAAFLPYRLGAACFAAAACGLQNAMCTSHFGAVVRTTHVTGTVTDIGSTLGRMAMIYMRKGCRRSRLNVLERAEVGVDARKLLVLLPMWLCFLIGGIAGAYVENALHAQRALLVPAAVTFLLGLAYMLFRQSLKDYIKKLEKERLNSDLHDIQAALARTGNLLQKEGTGDEELMAELDEEMGNVMEALQEMEVDVENLRSFSSRQEGQAGQTTPQLSGVAESDSYSFTLSPARHSEF